VSQLSYGQRVQGSSTYVLIAIVITAVIGLFLLVLGVGFASLGGFAPSLTSMGLEYSVAGIVFLFVVLGAYLTTVERIRRRDYAGARGPLLIWGGVSIVLAAVLGALVYDAGGMFLLLPFGEFFAGMLFIVAQSSIVPPPVAPPAASAIPESPRPLYAETRTQLKPEIQGPGIQGPAIAILQCKAGADAGNSFQVGVGRSRMGRGDFNEIRLQDPTVSRSHAEISFDGASFTIVDLGSSNGTYVDGTPVARGQPRRLREDAQIKLGEEVFQFKAQMQDRTRLAVPA